MDQARGFVDDQVAQGRTKGPTGWASGGQGRRGGLGGGSESDEPTDNTLRMISAGNPVIIPGSAIKGPDGTWGLGGRPRKNSGLTARIDNQIDAPKPIPNALDPNSPRGKIFRRVTDKLLNSPSGLERQKGRFKGGNIDPVPGSTINSGTVPKKVKED